MARRRVDLAPTTVGYARISTMSVGVLEPGVCVEAVRIAGLAVDKQGQDGAHARRRPWAAPRPTGRVVDQDQHRALQGRVRRRHQVAGGVMQ